MDDFRQGRPKEGRTLKQKINTFEAVPKEKIWRTFQQM